MLQSTVYMTGLRPKHFQYVFCSPPSNMRRYILIILLVIHTATATIDLQQLKGAAESKLQKISEAASSTIQEFVDSIDLEKVKQLDFLHILPKIEHKGKVIKDTYEKIPEIKKKVTFYVQSLKGLTKQDLLLAFDGGMPYPMLRKEDVAQLIKQLKLHH